MSEQIKAGRDKKVWRRSSYWPQLLLMIAIILYGVVIEWWFGWGKVGQAWAHVPVKYLIMALLLMFLTYLIRGWRIYNFFLPITHDGLMTCCRIMLIHNLLNNLLPLRSGEVSFPFLMQRYFAVSLSYATAGLLLLRLLDLQVLLGLGYLTLLLLWKTSSFALWGILILWFVSPLILLALAPWLQRYTKALHHESRLKRLLEQVLRAMPLNFGTLFRSWLFTLICWVSKIIVFAIVLGWFIPLQWWGAVGVSIGGELSSVLPIHAPAGLGTYEASMLVTGKLFNIAETKALLFAAIQLHLLMLTSTLLGAVIALFIPAHPSKK